MKKTFFCYKDKPLVRCGNTLYYGSMKDPYVVCMQVLSTKPSDNKEVASDVMIQLLRTGKDVKPQDMVVKKAQKSDLYSAIDIADVWLHRALKEA